MNSPQASIEAAVRQTYYNPQQKQFLAAELLYLVPMYHLNVVNLQLRSF